MAARVIAASTNMTRTTITGVGKNEPEPLLPVPPPDGLERAPASARLTTSEQLVYSLVDALMVFSACLSCATEYCLVKLPWATQSVITGLGAADAGAAIVVAPRATTTASRANLGSDLCLTWPSLRRLCLTRMQAEASPQGRPAESRAAGSPGRRSPRRSGAMAARGQISSPDSR